MKKIFLFLFFISILGCKKHNNYADNQTVEKIDFFLKNTSNNKYSEKEQLIYNDKALELLMNIENSAFKRKSMDLVIDNYFFLNQWEKYNKISRELLEISKSANDTNYIAKAMRYQGNYYYKKEVLDSSFYFYNKSEFFFKNIKDYNNYSIVLLKKGIVQLELNDFFGADISLTKAYNILKKTDDNQRIYAALNSLGTVSSELKEYDRAILYYKDALEIVTNAKLETSEHQTANCYNNIGLVYLDLKNYEKAIFYFKKAISEKRLKEESPLLYSSVIDNLAYSKLKKNDYKNIEKLFFESLKIRDSLNYSSYKILTYIHLSEYFYKINDIIKAKKYSFNAIETAKISKLPYYSIAALKQASIVDKENSSKYSEDYVRITDSLQIVERNSKDRLARIQLETDELKKQNLVLEERNRDVLNFLFGTILFVGFLYYMRVQRSKERELALKQAHQKANEEIYRLIISHQNQLEEGRDLEKKRLSKELHDGVLGRLFGLRLNLDGLNSFDDADAKQQRLEYLNELQIIEQDLREISHELSRENLVLINNFVAILNRLVEEQAKVNTAKIKMIIADDIQWDKVSNIIKINLYRILQEALQNINKHAQAKNISIHFRTDKKENLLFDIEDDGIGYDTTDKKKKGIGTKNIVERTQQCNGFIDIKSEVGVGSKIIITFPVDSKTIKI
ncbi:tetratricopeptide repeat-containing sensor histidine kinase [Flavobacterium sp.]|uniref:tetratricopeptide repeat-containing sensor histidine kinase n=1 Tax=Flavobacterium sp. TaxID=239 RepID=UPI00261E8194|nr:tetratricopeptide repeat-containing sensor histidine kinase [Flavobacterium sp.]